MSDNRSVARDRKHDAETMSEAAVIRAYTNLSELTKREHRGRGDTWGAALDRTARKIGIPGSYARRLWDRWQTMNDVSGGVFHALQQAYDAQVERNNDVADSYRARRKEIDGRPAREVDGAGHLGMDRMAAGDSSAARKG